jgi:hypothetical protein
LQLIIEHCLKSQLLLARLDRLQPLRLAFHDAWGVAAPCQEVTDQTTISEFFDWLNDCSHSKDRATVFWMYGDARSATTAVAQGVAKRAHEEGQLLASYFFSWTGDTERRDPANMIPTIMYKIALFDKDFLCRVAHAVDIDRDIRDKEASVQISVLLKTSFKDAIAPSGSPLLIVIDSLDACNHLDDPKIADDIALFIQTLTTLPLHVKIFITSRFTQAVRRVLEKLHPPGYRSHELPVFGAEERQTQMDIALHMSEADKGTP